jgi:PAS domain S-box-containing protein
MASERIQNILTSVSDKVQRLMEVDRFYVALYDLKRAELEFPLVVDSGDLVETGQIPWTTRAYQGYTWLPDRVIDQQAPLLFEHDLVKEIEEAEVEYWPLDGYPLSWLGVPVIFEEQLMGVLVAENRHKIGVFGERGKSVFSTIARQAAIAIENARLYERLERQVERLGAVSEVGRELTSRILLSEPEILESIYQQASRVMDTDNMYIALYDEATDTVSFAMALLGGRRVDVAKEKGWQPRQAGQGRTEWIIRHQEPLISNTKIESKAWYEDSEHKEYIGQPFASWIGVPMIVGEKVLGVIATYNTQEHAYDEDDLQVLSLIANQAAFAIENARLFEEEKRRATQLALISEVGEKAASILNSNRLMQEVTRSVQESFNYYNVALGLLDVEHYEVVVQAVAGGFEHTAPGEYRQPLFEGIVGFVVGTGNSWLANDVSKDPHYAKGFLGEVLTKSELCVPMKLGDKVIGVLDVQSIRLNDFDQADVAVMEVVADRLAIAIENARLFEEIEKRRLYLEGVLGAAPDAIVTLDARYRIVEWNPGAERLFGYSREEAIGQNLEHLVTNPDTSEEAVGLTRMVMSGREVPPLETVRYRKDGSYVHVIVAGSPILVGDELIGMVTVYTDITQRKRMEDALKEYSERLKEMVEERTQAWREAQERAAAAERLAVMSQVAAEFAHRMNNLAGTIPVRVNLAKGNLRADNPRDAKVIRQLDGIAGDALQLLQAAQEIKRTTEVRAPDHVVINELLEIAIGRVWSSRPDIEGRIAVKKPLPMTFR